MYIQTGEGLGQTTITRNGDQRFAWSECKIQSPRQRMCPFYLKVTFRHGFGDLRKEVERAFRRWMTGPRAQTLIQKREGDLRAIHKAMMDAKVPDNSPSKIGGVFIYRGPDGPRQEWRVVDVRLIHGVNPAAKPKPAQPPSPDQCRIEKGFLVCKKPCVPEFYRDGWLYRLAPGAADPSRPNECWYIRILAS